MGKGEKGGKMRRPLHRSSAVITKKKKKDQGCFPMGFLLHIAAIIDRDNHQVVRSQVLLYAAAGNCLSPCRSAWLRD